MITQKKLKSILVYCSDTGIFTWIKRNGRAAGSYDDGYVRIKIGGKKYYAHRLAWIYAYGSLPDLAIDHINRDRSDNRIHNLRDVSVSENLKNKSTYKTNKSGVDGVHWCKTNKRWVARIGVNGKKLVLGKFIYKFNAICARKSAENYYKYCQGK